MSARELVVATRNEHKVSEIRDILQDYSISVSHLGDYSRVPPALETGRTFPANALEKALHACRYLQRPCCADDSGIGVSVLRGAPGVRSARYAGEDATDEDNNALLLKRMQGVDRRTAYFSCAIALVVPEIHMEMERWSRCRSREWFHLESEGVWGWMAEASVYGTLLNAPVGSGGFGYDPLFYYEPTGCTFAQMTMQQKNAVSHRGRALRMLARALG